MRIKFTTALEDKVIESFKEYLDDSYFVLVNHVIVYENNASSIDFQIANGYVEDFLRNCCGEYSVAEKIDQIRVANGVVQFESKLEDGIPMIAEEDKDDLEEIKPYILNFVCQQEYLLKINLDNCAEEQSQEIGI